MLLGIHLNRLEVISGRKETTVNRTRFHLCTILSVSKAVFVLLLCFGCCCCLFQSYTKNTFIFIVLNGWYDFKNGVCVFFFVSFKYIFSLEINDQLTMLILVLIGVTSLFVRSLFFASSVCHSNYYFKKKPKITNLLTNLSELCVTFSVGFYDFRYKIYNKIPFDRNIYICIPHLSAQAISQIQLQR